MADMLALKNLLSPATDRGIAHALRPEIARASSWLRSQTPGPVALFLSDARLFSIWLLACWQDGRCVILPGDATPGTAQQLQARGALLLGDFAKAVRREPPESAAMTTLGPLTDALPAVEVFTSGSTGQPVCIAKTLRQLDAEVQVLEQIFGADLACDLEFNTTVSHQHLYGLLFSVLWPLARAQHALAHSLTYPEELIARDQNYLLISSPAFLKRLPRELPWPKPSRCQRLFSSGGPLPTSAAYSARECLGVRVNEIYGSSETGGIARRNDPNASWIPQPGVEVRMKDHACLAIRSPFLPNDEWFVTADRAQRTADGFMLMGRDDRIIKIEEKRISLTALENSLQAHRWVSEARIVALQESRTILAAVLVLAQAGQTKLAQDGKFAFSQALRAHLAEEFERIALPRRWRFVSQLPLNNMGKTTDQSLTALFTEKPRLPRILQQETSDTGLRLQLDLIPELACFEGHFPGLPILPGVAQLEWAMHFGRTLLGTPSEFQGMDAIKFQQIIRPGSQIDLLLDYLPAKQQLHFCYKSSSGQHSSGRIRLRETQA